ncbi:MAG: 3-deoxy-D-manno-octulosonic acid kinase [Lysobacterales bacterium]
MIEAQVQLTANGAIVFDSALGIAPDERWFERAHWAALGKAQAAAGGRGGATFVDTPIGACALRHYRRGGVVARLSADRYLWTGAARTRAFREFRLLAQLIGLGLPVPAPIAARYVRDGLRYHADLLTRRIDGARTVAERLAAGTLDVRLARAVGGAIARFHAAGVWHADLNAHNILADADGTVWLIDFDRSRVRKPALAWQQGNLARLRRSLDKLGATRRADFDAQFWHPLLAAYHAGLSPVPPASGSRGASR